MEVLHPEFREDTPKWKWLYKIYVIIKWILNNNNHIKIFNFIYFKDVLIYKVVLYFLFTIYLFCFEIDKFV